jgi:hypothetical protein
VEKTLEHLLEEVTDGFRVVVNALTAVRTISVADQRAAVAAIGWVLAPTSLIVGRRCHLRPRHDRSLASARFALYPRVRGTQELRHTKAGFDLLFPSETGGFRSPTVLDKPFKDDCQHLPLGKKVTPNAMRRTFQDLARRAAVDGLVQRSICGHLTEEMTERYSSVAQAEVQAALGKVVSLAGYRDLLRSSDGGKKRSAGKVVGKRSRLNHRRCLAIASTSYELAFLERDIGFEPTTFSLGRALRGRRAGALRVARRRKRAISLEVESTVDSRECRR